MSKLVFLPGWGFSADIWHAIARQFSDNECLLLDLPSMDEAAQIDAILNLLHRMIPAGSTLIGWSLGGLIATSFCARYPSHCQQLVLVASTPSFMASEHWAGISTIAKADFMEQFYHDSDGLKKTFCRQVLYPSRDKTHYQTLLSNHNQYQPAYLSILLGSDFRTEYSQLSLPIHVILGQEDIIVSCKNQHQLSILNHRTHIQCIENAGHALFLTHPTECITYLHQVL